MHHQQHYNQREIILGLKQRDPKIVSYFTDRLRERVQRSFQKRYAVWQQSWVEDSVSDSIIILFEKIDKIPDERLSLDNYAFGIAKHTFFGYLRKSAKVDYFATGTLPERAEETTSVHHCISERFMDEGHYQHWQWFMKLSLRSQQILNLKAQGYSSKEIAELVGLTSGSVRNEVLKLMNAAKEMVV